MSSGDIFSVPPADRKEDCDDHTDSEEEEMFFDCPDRIEDNVHTNPVYDIQPTPHISTSPESLFSDTIIEDEPEVRVEEKDSDEVLESLLIQNSLCDDDSSMTGISELNEQQMQCLEIIPVVDEIDKRKGCDEISGKRCNAQPKPDDIQMYSKDDDIGQADHDYTQETSKYPILQEAQYCNPCKDNGDSVAGSSWCQICKEYLCQTCSKLHKSRKATRTHDVVLLEDNPTVQMCDWCSYLDKVSASVRYCDVCEENLCQKCLDKHQTQKSTKAHLATDCEVGLTNNQQTCGSCTSNVPTMSFCSVCDKDLCKSCICEHLQPNANAEYISASMTERKAPEQSSINCSACEYQGHTTKANTYCIDCEEWLCPTCEEQHKLHISDHRLVTFDDMQFCRTCKNKEAERLCVDCKKPSAFCAECSSVHTSLKPSRGHTLQFISLILSQKELPTRDASGRNERPTFSSSSVNDNGLDDTNRQSFTHSEKIREIPGQPKLAKSKNISTDSVSIHWEHPVLKYDSCKYQIRYKEGEDGDWKFHDLLIPGDKQSTTVNKLRSNTVYTFQVRMVDNEKEGPYSKKSEKINTPESAAMQLLDHSTIIQKPGCPIPVRKVLFTKDQASYNTDIKSRRLEIGNDTDLATKQRTIMLLGATGSGKTTLVDSMANFIFGVNWDDPFRLSAVDLEEEEKDLYKNQALSQTQWITRYTIHPLKGSRLDYTLNIVDTPGFGDIKGIKRDEKIVDQIRMLFNDDSEKGITFVDAICFLVKAPDARLTPSQRYIFDSILSMFGNDISENICLFMTFADGNTPPVLEALRETELIELFEPHFIFNNSGLFVDNTSSSAPLAPMFWEMGLKSFESFFAKLVQMQTRSLTLTKQVLDRRQQLEITIENILPIIDAGLHKVNDLASEISVLLRHQRDIEDNKDFRYTVSETKQYQYDLPKGEHVTNCLQCHVTCHKKCYISADERKHSCAAMDQTTGYCTQCKCHWTQHKNTPYIFEYKTEQVQKTYEQKLAQYNIAVSNEKAHSIVVSRMEQELAEIENQLQEKIKLVNQYTNELKRIALRDKSLSLEEYIDLLISNEKNTRKEGFAARVDVLLHMKRKSNVADIFTHFKEKSTEVRQNAQQLTSKNDDKT